MRFPLLFLPCEFEIPDDWWTAAGMEGFTPSGRAYHSTAVATPVPLREIEPPLRSPEQPLDWHGFHRARLISLLKGIAAGAEIEPVVLRGLPPADWPPFRYSVRDGYHRFYASVAAGFECLPAVC
jgi:hypothetical protein